MALSKAEICDFGWKAKLKGVDGKTYALADVRGPEGYARCLHLQSLSVCEGEHRPDRGGS
jgi:hypothetical protein